MTCLPDDDPLAGFIPQIPDFFSNCPHNLATWTPNEPCFLVFMPFYNPLSFECGKAEHIDSLLMNRIWQTRWDVASKIMQIKDCGFQLGYSFFLALSWVIHPGESQLPCHKAALHRGLCGQRPRPAKNHMSELGNRSPHSQLSFQMRP